ncbi:hypothetical protein KC19_4G214000 [Ceratodon purpureus]|uniref:Leucine-rich repeat-containing N-terminal plant-type domain-containing protein n=1 Tax=Ceratodon purpureus TaxID=3225 RepID=A0A8T0IDJ1_CERPU|nr:hypothetical protein KC19_4G214000 [Ceratodon purpureus]
MSPQLALWWCLVLLSALIPTGVSQMGNSEVYALIAFRDNLINPPDWIKNWDDTLAVPCSLLRITCDDENKVIRMDLGNAGLSGALAPELGVLSHLQYLELYGNNFSGLIPKELGNLTALVSLDLYQNNFTGNIPDSLGQLSNLLFLRLNNNSLSGSIPSSLTNIAGLYQLDLSYNNLTGEVPNNGSFSRFTPISFIGNINLCGSLVNQDCPGQAPFSSSSPGSTLSPPNEMAPPNQESKNRKVIILASAISAAVLVFLILGLTIIVCQNRKHSQDLPK